MLTGMSYLRSYQEILEQIDAIDPVEYAQTRNHLNGAVTRLSPYISRGVITLPFVRDRLLENHSQKDSEKLIQELAWREYFQNVWWEKVDDIFSDLRFKRQDWKYDGLVSAIVSASTGIRAIDEAVVELYDTGYMHNHVRMWVASIACNLAGAHWHSMGQWLYYNLIDGDLASNFLSWQWVAGTSVNKRYTVSQDLINACSDSKQTDTWLAIERDDLLTMAIPDQLKISETAVFTMEYPETDIDTVSGAEVGLYTPWTLDPTWRQPEPMRRILVIDSQWFDRYPVSQNVLDFIIRQGQTVIPELEVYAGDIQALPGIDDASIYFKNHQTNQHWPGYRDQVERLFPNVTGYYPSFFKYWQTVKKHY
jgi:deoxyribodipyrimidine photo-lyase